MEGFEAAKVEWNRGERRIRVQRRFINTGRVHGDTLQMNAMEARSLLAQLPDAIIAIEGPEPTGWVEVGGHDA